MADIDVIDAEKRFGANHVIRRLNLHVRDGEFVVRAVLPIEETQR